MIVIEAISWLPTLLWVALAGLILYWGFSSRAREARGCLVVAIAGGLLVLLLASSFLRASAVFVEPTKRGVVISALEEGVRPDTLQPGVNFVVPFLENVILYPITRQTYTMSIAPQEGQIVGDDSVEARTSDGQIVRVDASVIFSIDPGQVVSTHIRWRDQYINNLIRPQARGIIRDAVSQFAAEELYTTKRFALSAQIEQAMKAVLEDEGLILHDFVLRNIAFSPEFAASMEQKQIAKQLAQPDLLEASGAAQPEIPAFGGTSQSSALESIRSILESLACIALPILMFAAVIARRRRPAPRAQSSPPSDLPSDARLGEQARGRGEPPTPGAWEEYEQGMAYLEQERLEEAKGAFMRAFRNADDPDLRQKALSQLEDLGEVKKF